MAAGPPTATHCLFYDAGSGTTINSGTAVTFSNGYAMSTQIGLSLSTSTGFTNQAAVNFNFLANSNLCGSNNYPFSAARIVGK